MLNSEVEEKKKKKFPPHSWGLWLGQIIKLAKKKMNKRKAYPIRNEFFHVQGRFHKRMKTPRSN